MRNVYWCNDGTIETRPFKIEFKNIGNLRENYKHTFAIVLLN